MVRLWLEEDGSDAPLWRGHIQHVQTGQATYFSGLDGMLDFVVRLTGRRPSTEAADLWRQAPPA